MRSVSQRKWSFWGTSMLRARVMVTLLYNRSYWKNCLRIHYHTRFDSISKLAPDYSVSLSYRKKNLSGNDTHININQFFKLQFIIHEKNYRQEGNYFRLTYTFLKFPQTQFNGLQKNCRISWHASLKAKHQRSLLDMIICSKLRTYSKLPYELVCRYINFL